LSAYVNVYNGDARGAACLVVGFVVHPVPFKSPSHVVFLYEKPCASFLVGVGGICRCHILHGAIAMFEPLDGCSYSG